MMAEAQAVVPENDDKEDDDRYNYKPDQHHMKAEAQAVVPENDDKEDDDRDSTSAAPLLQEIQDDVKSFIFKHQYDKLEESLEAVKSTKLLIAVIGASCTGKSSFINKMLGLKEGDEGAAPIGDGDTTKEPTEFSHPKNKLLAFMDLPGFGPPDFDKTDEYLERIKVDTYDFFLIFYRSVITEDCNWIIGKLRTKGKKFALVRAKADDMDRGRKSVQERIDRVKLKTQENLRKFGNKDIINIFVISNKCINIGEFDKLFNFIENSLPDLKQMAIVIHAFSITEKIIAKKKDLLLKRAWVAAASMGIVTGMPLPGVDIPINIALMVKEVRFYLQSFGLTEEMMQRYPDRVKNNLTVTKLIYQTGIKTYIMIALGKAPIILSTVLAQQALEFIFPVAGSIMTGAAAFAVYVKVLRYIIHKLASEADFIRKHHIEQTVRVG